MENTGRGGSIDQSAYLIDHFRVVFEFGGGWHCVCREFVSANTCCHTREAAGRKLAQAQIMERLTAGRSQLAQHNARKSHATSSPT
jgi:hypothetical protein